MVILACIIGKILVLAWSGRLKAQAKARIGILGIALH